MTSAGPPPRSRYPFGTRVFALREVADGVAYSYGEGTYVDDSPPSNTPDFPRTEADLSAEDIERYYAFLTAQDASDVHERDALWLYEKGANAEVVAAHWTAIRSDQAKPMRQRVVDRLLDDYRRRYSSPRIELDSGATVWGSQCWFGPVDVVRRRFPGVKFIEVEPPGACLVVPPST